jgi:hypothetical protein
MKCIATDIKKYDETIFANAEKSYSVKIRDDIKEFIKENTGGYPVKNTITSDGEKFEVRVFLSADFEDKNYCIDKPMGFFLQKTKGKIIPIGIDSGDNYYCVNNETGKVYYWSAEEDRYYCIAVNLEEFVELF